MDASSKDCSGELAYSHEVSPCTLVFISVPCTHAEVDRLLGEPLQEALLEEANPLFQEIEDVLIRK